MGDITELLIRARHRDAAAIDAVFSELYPQLRRMAHARLAGGGRHTMLETSVLVHECYLKFADAGRLTVNDRAYFLTYAARDAFDHRRLRAWSLARAPRR